MKTHLYELKIVLGNGCTFIKYVEAKHVTDAYSFMSKYVHENGESVREITGTRMFKRDADKIKKFISVLCI